jgi:hypothetical protein
LLTGLVGSVGLALASIQTVGDGVVILTYRKA